MDEKIINEENNNNEEILTGAPVVPAIDGSALKEAGELDETPIVLTADRGGRSEGGRGGKRRRNERNKKTERPKSEFDQKLLTVRRVARVVAGGRRFSFAVALVIGDRKGAVGVGTGKASDTSMAIEKAVKNARKNLIRVPLNKKGSISHDVIAKASSGVVALNPNFGRGLIAGSSPRAVLALAGVKDVTAKIHAGTKNRLNNARATIKALTFLKK